MKNIQAYLLLIAALVALTGCSSSALRWTPEYHTVRSGETLYSIAVSYDLNYTDLARWNSLGDGSVIREGQRLRLRPATGQSGASGGTKQAAAQQPVAPQPSWRWPTQGSVYLRFQESPKTGSGVRISGKSGQAVRAVAAGEVVYAGDGLASYGQLLIIKHNSTWLSAYGFNSSLAVAEGQSVSSGQRVASMGQDSSGKAVLHFEIRKNGQPVDPLRYLPKPR